MAARGRRTDAAHGVVGLFRQLLEMAIAELEQACGAVNDSNASAPG